MKIPLILMGFLLLASPSKATTAEEYGKMGKTVWAAFECSVFAGKSKKEEEGERLFMFGYKTGKKLINSLKKEGKNFSEKSSELPIVIKYNMSGPSTDFILGRIFENAIEDAYKTFKTNTLASNNEESSVLNELESIAAGGEYRARNCSLITE